MTEKRHNWLTAVAITETNDELIAGKRLEDWMSGRREWRRVEGRRSLPVTTHSGGKLLSNDIICRYGGDVVERPIGSGGGDARAQYIL